MPVHGRAERRVKRAAPRRSAVGADTRERILESALEVFSVRGFDGATTRDLAAHAGVNLGLIQYYFGGKERLWRAAVERVFARLWATFESTADLDPRDPATFVEIIRIGVRFAAANPALIRLMNDEGKRSGRRLRWLVDRHSRRFHDTLAALVRPAQRAGVLPDVPPVHFYYIFIGALGLIFSQAAECRRLTGTDPTTSEAVIATHADALVRLLVRPPV
jgi:AcrR family transcriptional regulator